MYPDLPSSITPVLHCLEILIPTLPEKKQPSIEESSNLEEKEDVKGPDYNFRNATGERNPYYPSQKDFCDLIRDLCQTKSNANLLMSKLKEWNFFYESMQVKSQRKDQQHFLNFFNHQDKLCFCYNVFGLHW